MVLSLCLNQVIFIHILVLILILSYSGEDGGGEEERRERRSARTHHHLQEHDRYAFIMHSYTLFVCFDD